MSVDEKAKQILEELNNAIHCPTCDELWGSIIQGTGEPCCSKCGTRGSLGKAINDG